MKIQNKTPRAILREKRNEMILDLNAQYRDKHPEYNGWQRAVRITGDLLQAVEDGELDATTKGISQENVRLIMIAEGVFNP